MLVYCHAGCNSVDILKILSQKGFLENLKHIKPCYDDKPKEQKNNDYIAKILQEVCPIEGTLAERYLKETRGIKCPLSPMLKYHSRLYHSPTKQLLPAMIGVVTDFTGLHIQAIHRTYLTHLGQKANIEPNKMMLGKCLGGGVFVSLNLLILFCIKSKTA